MPTRQQTHSGAPTYTRLVSLSILEGAEHLLPLAKWGPLDPRLQLLRASIASISSYIFFNRGEYNALCLADDMVVTTDHITLRLW